MIHSITVLKKSFTSTLNRSSPQTTEFRCLTHEFVDTCFFYFPSARVSARLSARTYSNLLYDGIQKADRLSYIKIQNMADRLIHPKHYTYSVIPSTYTAI